MEVVEFGECCKCTTIKIEFCYLNSKQFLNYEEVFSKLSKNNPDVFVILAKTNKPSENNFTDVLNKLSQQQTYECNNLNCTEYNDGVYYTIILVNQKTSHCVRQEIHHFRNEDITVGTKGADVIIIELQLNTSSKFETIGILNAPFDNKILYKLRTWYQNYNNSSVQWIMNKSANNYETNFTIYQTFLKKQEQSHVMSFIYLFIMLIIIYYLY